ncbi:MAG: hypothetical protein ACRBCS_09165 [Cellvibrionaceae bacterium]
MSDDKNDNVNNDADIMLALDQLSESMETICNAIDGLKHNLADTQQSLIEKYNTAQAKKRAQELKASKKMLEEKTNTKTNSKTNNQDTNDDVIYETPIVIH